MKKIKEYFSLIDDQGLVPGKEVWFYPYGTTSHGTKADEVVGKPGEYVIEIDPSADNLKISKYCDIWYDGVRQYEKVTLKDKWEWFTRIQFTDTDLSQDFLFADLIDENGHNLPGSIPKAIVDIMTAEADRYFSISVQDDDGFTIDAAASGGAKVPIYIKLYITIK